MTELGTPVIAARLWCDAVVPRAGGGWNVIMPLYNAPNLNPVEWIVAHAEGNTYERYEQSDWTSGKQGKYPNQNFKSKHQLRAPNGDVFFVAVSAWNYVYDLATETVITLGRCPDGNGVVVTDGNTYSAVFNQTGSILACGTTAAGAADKRPMVYTINTTTRTMTPLCRVGSARSVANGWVYYLVVDGDWLYACVGQGTWDVIAVHIPTRVETIFGTESTNAWAYFVQREGGVTAQLVENNKIAGESITEWWLIDGEAIPYVAGEPSPSPRDTVAYKNATVEPIQTDYSQRPKSFAWRPYGSTDAWTTNEFEIEHSSPIDIESLTALSDGTILGNAVQYRGFFGVDDATVANYGEFLGVSDVVTCVVGTIVYITGYPNGVLWKFDTALPWSTTNPVKLGSFSNSITHSGVKRITQLKYDVVSGRLQAAGLRDRTGFGAGIGLYNIAAGTFGGHFTDLEMFTGRLGLAVLPASVVMTGLTPDETESQLVIYSLALVESARQTPIAGLKDLGPIYKASSTDVVGLSRDGALVYRWNTSTGTMVESVDLTAEGAIGVSTQLGSSTLVTMLGTNLVAIDLLSLDRTIIGDLASVVGTHGAITCIAAVSSTEVYVSAGTHVVKVAVA